jgi:hypothetical protein
MSCDGIRAIAVLRATENTDVYPEAERPGRRTLHTTLAFRPRVKRFKFLTRAESPSPKGASRLVNIRRSRCSLPERCSLRARMIRSRTLNGVAKAVKSWRIPLHNVIMPSNEAGHSKITAQLTTLPKLRSCTVKLTHAARRAYSTIISRTVFPPGIMGSTCS